MSTLKSTSRRTACAVILALFTASVIAGTVCTGHSTPHAAQAYGWIPAGVESVAVSAEHKEPHRSAPATDPHDATEPAAPVSRDTPSPGDDPHGVCNPPAYTATTPASGKAKQIKVTNHVQLHMLAPGSITEVWSVSPEALRPRPPPDWARGRLQDLFAVSARLRI